MCTPEVEKEIEKLDPEISKIYFDAKHEMLNANDSRCERFSAAARIVRAFWKRISANQGHGK
jgi:mRNA-degrading endonuclease RelE of RelBE toxin-antitoxin system